MSDKKLQSNIKKEALTKNNKRKHRGEVDETVMFPVAPTTLELPEEYASWLSDLKSNIAQTQVESGFSQ